MDSQDVATNNTSGATAIECNPTFIVNAGHIEQRDAQLLESLAIANGDLPPINCGLCGNTKYGFLLWIGGAGLEGDYAAELSNAGFSASLTLLLERIRSESSEFCYLLLDSDGPKVADLPLHDW